jgi:serine/threonine protein kinase
MQRHSFTAINSTFIVDSEYLFVKELGQGAYGCVVAAKHRKSGEGCAIKKITNINTKVRTTPMIPRAYLIASSEDPYETMFERDKVYLHL